MCEETTRVEELCKLVSRIRLWRKRIVIFTDNDAHLTLLQRSFNTLGLYALYIKSIAKPDEAKAIVREFHAGYLPHTGNIEELKKIATTVLSKL